MTLTIDGKETPEELAKLQQRLDFGMNMSKQIQARCYGFKYCSGEMSNTKS